MKRVLLAGCLILTTISAISQKHEVKVAMPQILALDGDLAGNIVRIENVVAEAKEKGADIVAFPESCLLGWLNPSAHQRASTIPGNDTDKLCALAKQYGIFINIGLDEKVDGKLYGAAILIDDNGKILLKHRKINVLPELMSPSYASGNQVEVIDTRFGRIGILICADSFQEDLLAKMKEKEPALLLIPYGWAADESEWPAHGKELEKVVKHAAMKVRCPVIGVDLVGEISEGPWRGKTYGGQSFAADKDGKIIGRGKDRDRDIIMVTVSIELQK